MAKKRTVSRRRYRKKTKTRKRKNVIRGGLPLLKIGFLGYLFSLAKNKYPYEVDKYTDSFEDSDEAQYKYLQELEPDKMNQLLEVNPDPKVLGEYNVDREEFNDIKQELLQYGFPYVFPDEETEEKLKRQETAQRKERNDF